MSGNVKRGMLAMSGVLFLFVCGVAVGGVDCIDRTEDRLWFIGQAGCGPITFGVDAINTAQLKSGAAAPLIELPPSVADPNPRASSFKGLAHANEFGTFFVFLAGLMNVCVVLDALVRAPKSDGISSGRRTNDAAAVGGGA